MFPGTLRRINLSLSKINTHLLPTLTERLARASGRDGLDGLSVDENEKKGSATEVVRDEDAMGILLLRSVPLIFLAYPK